MLRYLSRVEKRKTVHTVVVIMRTVIRAFPFQEPSCALQAGHHLTRLKGKKKPTIRSGKTSAMPKHLKTRFFFLSLKLAFYCHQETLQQKVYDIRVRFICMGNVTMKDGQLVRP